ncbi:MAG: SpaA isopeptide-forming pilin-related protein [Erysipelotrichaceae bacterium]|nr:SpaA isopeptide-forming pilin-related protein [Erysipelotrichaceae bacterium]
MKDDVLANLSKYDQEAHAKHIASAKDDAQLLADKEAQDRANHKARVNADDIAHIIIGTETVAPEKYLLNTQRQIVVSTVTYSEKRDANEKLTYGDFHYTLTTEYDSVENKRYTASATIHKVDGETKEPLEGVILELYAATNIRDTYEKVIFEENKKIGTFAPTDSEGNTSINDLYPGDYYVVEAKSAFGYALNTEKQYLSIQTDDKNVGVDVTVEVANDKQQLFVKVIKTFEDTVTYYDDEEYDLFGTVVPEENGQLAPLEWLPSSYYIQESKTNENFVIDETHYEFTLSYDDSG